LASSSDPALAKTLYKVSFPWIGIWRAYPFPSASDPVVGKGLRPLIGWTWSWRSSLLFCAPDGLVGAVPLLARQPLEELCLHRPAPVLLGGVVSRLLAQPALRVVPVFTCRSCGDSWDASRHIARLVVRPLSHPHDMDFIEVIPSKGGAKARRGIPRWRGLHNKRGEETSSPP
jgi:hypothetical protein